METRKKEYKDLTKKANYSIISWYENKYAGVAELADAQDLGSCVYSCRFKSCHPYQKSPKAHGFGGFLVQMKA